MASVNKLMDPQQTARTMQEFERENMKMEMTEEMSEYLTHVFVCLSISDIMSHSHQYILL